MLLVTSQNSLEASAVAAGDAGRPSLSALMVRPSLNEEHRPSRVTDVSVVGVGGRSQVNEQMQDVNTSPVITGGGISIHGHGTEVSVSEDSRRLSEHKIVSEVARDFVWPHVKFVLCEEDKDEDSPMAKIVFDHVLTSCRETYWDHNRDSCTKALQQKRGTCTHAVKEEFLGEFRSLGALL